MILLITILLMTRIRSTKSKTKNKIDPIIKTILICKRDKIQKITRRKKSLLMKSIFTNSLEYQYILEAQIQVTIIAISKTEITKMVDGSNSMILTSRSLTLLKQGKNALVRNLMNKRVKVKTRFGLRDIAMLIYFSTRRNLIFLRIRKLITDKIKYKYLHHYFCRINHQQQMFVNLSMIWIVIFMIVSGQRMKLS